MTQELNLQLVVTAATQAAVAAVRQVAAETAKIGPAGQKSGDVAAAGLERMQQAAVRARRSFVENTASIREQLTGLQGAIAGALSVRGLVSAADNFTQLDGRLRLVSSSTAEYTQRSRELLAIAQANGQALEPTVSLYARTAGAIRSLTGESRDAVSLAQLVAQSFRISGASAEAAAGATQQLTQALESGVLRGDEFNSINEQGSRLTQALADGLGVARGELRAMADAGELTADRVLPALLSQMQRISEEAASLPQSMGQSASRLGNAFVVATDKANGLQIALSGIKAAIDALASSPVALGAIVDVAATLAATVAIGKLVSGVAGYRQRLLEVAQARRALSAAETQAAAADTALAAARQRQALTASATELAAAEARAAAASRTLAAAQVGASGAAAATASRFGGLLGILGGPWVAGVGLAVASGLTLYDLLRNKTPEAAGKSADAVEMLIETYERLGRAKARVAAPSLTETESTGLREAGGRVAKLQGALAAARAIPGVTDADPVVVGLQAEIGRLTEVIQGVAQAANERAAAPARGKLAEFNARFESESEKTRRLLDEYRTLVREAGGQEDPAVIRRIVAEGAPKSATRDKDTFADQARDSLRDAIGDEAALQGQITAILTPVERFRRELAAINLEAADGTLAEVAQRAGLTVDEVRNRRLAMAAEKLPRPADDGADEADTRTRNRFTDLTAFAEQGARNIQSAFADFLFDPLDGGLKGFALNFTKTLRQIAAQAAASVLLRSLFGGLAGSSNPFLAAIGGAVGGPLQKKAAGGLIRGPGSDTSDRVPLWGSAGEFMVKARAVRRVGLGFLEALNDERLPGFAAGGLVSAGAPMAAGLGASGRNVAGEGLTIQVDARNATDPAMVRAAVQAGVSEALARVDRNRSRRLPASVR